jgi:two-component system NtrC family sensor kinase
MLNRELHDLNNIIKSALIFMEYRIKTEHVSLRKKFTPNIPKVQVNADDIFLVIVNLLTNAFDSMQKGGKLLIESKCYKGRNTYVQFSISDTGCGIEKNEIDRIYDPFFTIKAGRKRNGLGLTICQAIIENHCGKIKVVSSLGEGTTFTCILPCKVNNNAKLSVRKQQYAR